MNPLDIKNCMNKKWGYLGTGFIVGGLLYQALSFIGTGLFRYYWLELIIQNLVGIAIIYFIYPRKDVLVSNKVEKK